MTKGKWQNRARFPQRRTRPPQQTERARMARASRGSATRSTPASEHGPYARRDRGRSGPASEPRQASAARREKRRYPFEGGRFWVLLRVRLGAGLA